MSLGGQRRGRITSADNLSAPHKSDQYPLVPTDADDPAVASLIALNPSHVAERVLLEARDYVLDADGTAQPAPAGHALGSASWYTLEEATFEFRAWHE